jgi:ribose 5-phosphate isomerase A
MARGLGIPLATLGEHRRIDLAIDGADEVERGTLDLIKGHGGALLREKIVAAASDRFLVVVDDEKLVDRLGERFPVPVEIAQFGWQATAAALVGLGTRPALRQSDGCTFVTDGGNFILDCPFGPIVEPLLLERAINKTVGVVENGLFLGRSTAVIVASSEGVETLVPGNRNSVRGT